MLKKKAAAKAAPEEVKAEPGLFKALGPDCDAMQVSGGVVIKSDGGLCFVPNVVIASCGTKLAPMV